jgi:hypothetical protein
MSGVTSNFLTVIVYMYAIFYRVGFDTKLCVSVAQLFCVTFKQHFLSYRSYVAWPPYYFILHSVATLSIIYELFSNTCLHTTFQVPVLSNFSISEIRMAGIMRDKKIKISEDDLEFKSIHIWSVTLFTIIKVNGTV